MVGERRQSDYFMQDEVEDKSWVSKKERNGSRVAQTCLQCGGESEHKEGEMGVVKKKEKEEDRLRAES